jgi:nicotinamidase-related amidase
MQQTHLTVKNGGSGRYDATLKPLALCAALHALACRSTAEAACRTATRAGVASTTRNAYEPGYNVTLVVAAMADRSAEAHRHSVEKAFPRLGGTDTTQNVLKLLRKR